MTITPDRLDDLDFPTPVIPYGRDDLSAPTLTRPEWRQIMDEMEVDYREYLIEQQPLPTPAQVAAHLREALRRIGEHPSPGDLTQGLLHWIACCSPSRGQFFDRYQTAAQAGRMALEHEPVMTAYTWVPE
jgi:hypothetical protein